MKKTDITKNSIIEATTELLRDNGNVTIKEISEKAGVNIAAINYHFTDKQNLIRVVIQRVMDGFKRVVEDFLESGTGSPEILRESAHTFLTNFYNYIFTNFGILRYVTSPANKTVMETSGDYFLDEFAMNSPFTKKILNKLAQLSDIDSNSDEIKVKYAIIFSALSFPLLFNIHSIGAEKSQKLFLLSDEKTKKLYIDQLILIITSKNTL